jgi:hypothetical protein
VVQPVKNLVVVLPPGVQRADAGTIQEAIGLLPKAEAVQAEKAGVTMQNHQGMRIQAAWDNMRVLMFLLVHRLLKA